MARTKQRARGSSQPFDQRERVEKSTHDDLSKTKFGKQQEGGAGFFYQSSKMQVSSDDEKNSGDEAMLPGFAKISSRLRRPGKQQAETESDNGVHTSTTSTCKAHQSRTSVVL